MPSRGPVALQRQRRQLLHPASAVAAREPGPPRRGPWAAAWPFVSRTTRRWNRPPRRPRPGGTVLPRTVPDKFAGRNAGKKKAAGHRAARVLCAVPARASTARRAGASALQPRRGYHGRRELSAPTVATPAGRLRSWPGQSWSIEDGGLEDGPVDLGRDADLPSHHLPPRLGVPAGS